jgi:hypothetical protein
MSIVIVYASSSESYYLTSKSCDKNFILWVSLLNDFTPGRNPPRYTFTVLTIGSTDDVFTSNAECFVRIGIKLGYGCHMPDTRCVVRCGFFNNQWLNV